MTIEERLTRLEKQNRRLRMVFSAGAMALVGAIGFGFAQEAKIPQTIDAGRFRVVNEGGDVLAAMGGGVDSESGALIIFGEDQVPVLAVTAGEVGDSGDYGGNITIFKNGRGGEIKTTEFGCLSNGSLGLYIGSSGRDVSLSISKDGGQSNLIMRRGDKDSIFLQDTDALSSLTLFSKNYPDNISLMRTFDPEVDKVLPDISEMFMLRVVNDGKAEAAISGGVGRPEIQLLDSDGMKKTISPGS